MSFPPPPSRPVGDSPAAIYMQRLWDINWDPKVSIFVDTPLLKFNKTPKGYEPVLRIPATSPPGKTLDANYKVMVVTALGSAQIPPNYDLLVCQEWDMKTGGIKSATNVYVAKDLDTRRDIVKEFYADNGDNLTQTYAYFTPTQSDATYGDNFRLASDGTNQELQVMEKRYYTMAMLLAQVAPVRQALVYVVDTGAPTGIKDPQGNDVTKIEVKPFRAWIRYATQ